MRRSRSAAWSRTVAFFKQELGEPPKRLEIPHALREALDLATKLRVRSIALPMLGTTAGAPRDDRLDAARVVIETFVAQLRTRPHRIERGILVSRFEDDRAPLQELLTRARVRRWTE